MIPCHDDIVAERVLKNTELNKIKMVLNILGESLRGNA